MIYKKDIKTLGNVNDNNYLTQRVSLKDESETSIKEAIRDIGVIKRSIYYSIGKKGTNLNFYLTLADDTKVEVHKKIWEKFSVIPVNIEKKKKIKKQ